MRKSEEYQTVISSTAEMVSDRKVQALAHNYGLEILNVTWEDTGRFAGSSVGPNISDMTIQVQHKSPGSSSYELTCMPVIRTPNFSDVTGDISPDFFYLLVGNETGKPLEKVTLREFLGDLRNYLHDASSWAGDATSLLADRDTHVLVSAQACFLPVPKDGIAEFNPVLFNYQSVSGDPAVLTILATREGTSVTVIDNERDAFQSGDTWGQRLFFNQNGERASLTGQRLSDFEASNPALSTNDLNGKEASAAGLNMVLLIQVPLKQREPIGTDTADYFLGESSVAFCCDVEDAVIGHGEVEGPFTEIDGLAIQRDDRFPIRVTVQFYKATSNGVVSETEMAAIASQIQRVYAEADYVGSLVLDDLTGRPTEHSGPAEVPPDWWSTFSARHRQNTGQTEDEAKAMLGRLLGKSWPERTLAEVDEALGQATQENVIKSTG